MYFAFDGLFHVQIADAAKMTAKSQRALIAQPSAARACSLSASSTCLGRRSFSCFMATSLSLSLLIGLKETRPNLWRLAIEPITILQKKIKMQNSKLFTGRRSLIEPKRRSGMTPGFKMGTLVVKRFERIIAPFELNQTT